MIGCCLRAGGGAERPEKLVCWWRRGYTAAAVARRLWEVAAATAAGARRLARGGRGPLIVAAGPESAAGGGTRSGESRGWAGRRAQPRAGLAVLPAAGVGTCHHPPTPGPCAATRVPGAALVTAGVRGGPGVGDNGGGLRGALWPATPSPAPASPASLVPGDPARLCAASSGRGNELFCKWTLRARKRQLFPSGVVDSLSPRTLF